MVDSTVVINHPAGGERVAAELDPSTGVKKLVVQSAGLTHTAFGELAIAKSTPIIQAAAQYNIIGARMRSLSVGASATAVAANGEFQVNSGTAAGGFSAIFSKAAANYHAGEGIQGRFTARFGAPLTGARASAGLINATDNLTFGYLDLDFGIFHNHHGQQEIRVLTLTAAGNGSETATLTLDTTDVFTIPLAATAENLNAVEIANYVNANSTLWIAQAIGETVLIRSLLSGPYSGTYSYTSSGTSTGTIAQTSAGVAITSVFIAQADWNGATVTNWLDEAGNSEPFNPAMGNVFQVECQYLGYGTLKFFIENPATGDFLNVHTIRWPNANTQPSLSNPAFRIGWSTSNTTTTTGASVNGASCAVFMQGEDVFLEEAESEEITATISSATNIPILSIRNREVFGTKINLSTMVFELLSVATDSNKGAVFSIIKNCTLTGAVFDYKDETASVALIDTSATACTGGRIVASETIGATSSGDEDLARLNVFALPGDTLTIVARRVSGSTSTEMTASIVWQEDI